MIHLLNLVVVPETNVLGAIGCWSGLIWFNFGFLVRCYGREENEVFSGMSEL